MAGVMFEKGLSSLLNVVVASRPQFPYLEDRISLFGIGGIIALDLPWDATPPPQYRSNPRFSNQTKPFRTSLTLTS